MGRVFEIATIIVLGAMLADLVTHPDGTKAVVNGVSNIWGTSMKAVAGQSI